MWLFGWWWSRRWRCLRRFWNLATTWSKTREWEYRGAVTIPVETIEDLQDPDDRVFQGDAGHFIAPPQHRYEEDEEETTDDEAKEGRKG
jgi:hypothetical protein